MIETEYRLDTSVSATLVSGGATVSEIGPVLHGERWHITLFSAQGPSPAKLEIFRGNNKIDGTNAADNDTSNTDITLTTGEKLKFVWSGGTDGTTMICYLSGERFVKGQRAY